MNKNQHEGLVKFLCDYLPLIVFFAVYKFAKVPNPLIIATLSMVIVTFFALLIGYLLTKKISNIALFSGLVLGVFGSLTYFLESDLFIKIKPTILNSLFAVILFYGNFTKKPLLAKLLGEQIKISKEAWLTLSKRWALYFVGLALLNEIIWRNFPTDFWVNFKVFGMLPLSIIFTASQLPFMVKEMKKFEKKS